MLFDQVTKFKDDISTGCRLVDKDCINACNSIFITILHQSPQLLLVYNLFFKLYSPTPSTAVVLSAYNS